MDVAKLSKPRNGAQALRAGQGSGGPRRCGTTEKGRGRHVKLQLHDDSDDNWVNPTAASDSDVDSDVEMELSGDPKREEWLKTLLESYRSKVQQSARNWLKNQIEWKVQRKRYIQDKTKPPQSPRVIHPPALKTFRKKNPTVEESIQCLRTKHRWKVREREGLRRLILAFGPQRLELIQKKVSEILDDRNSTGPASPSSSNKVGRGDVLDCIWSFLVSVENEVKNSRESSFMSDLLDRVKREATEKGWLVSGDFPPVVSTGEPTWGKIDGHGVSWARRLELLDRIRQAFEDFQSPEKLGRIKRAFDRIPETNKPAQWWSSNMDIELIKSAYKDGYGVYEDFYKKGFFSSAILSEKNKGAPAEKPNADALTKRLKKAVEILSKEEKTINPMRELPRGTPLSPKSRTDPTAERKPNRRNCYVFTKKEKTELIKYISVHGFPRKSTGETDWIRLCSASNFSQKDPQGMESTCIDIMEEAERVLINPPDARDENGNRRKISNLLTYPTANRLRERVELIDTLHASFKILKGDWSTFPLDRGVPQELPPWWKIGFHDKALCRGVLKHGYGNWVKISEDPSLVFHTLIEPNSSSAEDKALRPCVVPEKFAIKRLKHLNLALKKLMRDTKRRREIELPAAEAREDLHSSKPKRQKILKVERHTDGRPILPVKITDRLKLIELGFKTMREQQSFLPDKERIWYCCEIADSGMQHPLFRVYPNDRKDIVVEKDTPSGAWAEIFSRVQHFKSFREAGNDIKDYDPASYSARTMLRIIAEMGGRKYTNKTQSQNAGYQPAEEASASADGGSKSRDIPKNAVSGTENFGLANPTIAHLISQLPHVDEITEPKGLYNPNSQELKTRGRGKRKPTPDEPSSVPRPKVETVEKQVACPIVNENSSGHKSVSPFSNVKYPEKEADGVKHAKSSAPNDSVVGGTQSLPLVQVKSIIPPGGDTSGTFRVKPDVTASKQMDISETNLVLSPLGKMNGAEERYSEIKESMPLKESKFRIHTEIEERGNLEPLSRDVMVPAVINGIARENGNGFAS